MVYWDIIILRDCKYFLVIPWEDISACYGWHVLVHHTLSQNIHLISHGFYIYVILIRNYPLIVKYQLYKIVYPPMCKSIVFCSITLTYFWWILINFTKHYTTMTLIFSHVYVVWFRCYFHIYVHIHVIFTF